MTCTCTADMHSVYVQNNKHSKTQSVCFWKVRLRGNNESNTCTKVVSPNLTKDKQAMRPLFLIPTPRNKLFNM